jgi:N-methylhydantoinase A
MQQFDSAGDDPAVARIARRPVYFDRRGFVESDVFARDRLRPGMLLRGPAIVEEPTSVTLITPGMTASVAADLGLFVKLKGAA